MVDKTDKSGGGKLPAKGGPIHSPKPTVVRKDYSNNIRRPTQPVSTTHKPPPRKPNK